MSSLTRASTTAYTVAVVDEDPKMRTRLAVQLGERSHAGVYSSLEAMTEKTGDETLVIVAGPSLFTEDNIARVAQLVKNRPSTAAILAANDPSTQLVLQAMRSGISDVVPLPAHEEQLSNAVERAAEGLKTVFHAIGGVEVAVGEGQNRGRVTTVFSTKGGSGKSVIACNLAVLLARNSERPVVLLDADLQFGDVAVMLKLTPGHTIVDAISNIDRLDPALLKSLLVRHERSGVMILAGPREPGFADQVNGTDMAKIIDMLASFAGHVVIDTPSQFNEVNLSVLENSDDIILVAGMDVPAIKNVKIGLQVLRLLDMPVSRVRLLLNRANSKANLDIKQVEKTLQLTADVLVPSDVLVPRSVNSGNPVVLESPKSAVTKSIEQLASLVSGDVNRNH